MAGRYGEYDLDNPYAGGAIQEDLGLGGLGSAAATGLLGGMTAGTGLGLVGLGLGAYGQYKQGQQAEKNYELALKNYVAQQQEAERQQEETRKERERRIRQDAFNNSMTGGRYAQDLGQDMAKSYGSYARTYGLTG